jgi:hypothetical protein
LAIPFEVLWYATLTMLRYKPAIVHIQGYRGMGTLRFLGLALGLMVVTFLGFQRFLAPRPLQPDARLPAFHQVDPNDPRTKMEMTSFVSDNDAVRDELRKAVLEAANALSEEPCNSALKARYVEAATRYARAWLSIVPCFGRTACGSSIDAQLDRAKQAFGTPLDRRVREAMKKTHERAPLATADFATDVVVRVAQMADDAVVNPQAEPEFKAAAQESRDAFGCRSASLR